MLDDRSKTKGEFSAGLRVRLTPEAGGSRAVVSYVATIMVGKILVVLLLVLVQLVYMTVGLVREGESLFALLGWALVVAVVPAYPVINHLRRDRYFPDLADSLEALLGPLMASEDLARSGPGRAATQRARRGRRVH